MSPIPINLAVEDDLSEWVLRVLIDYVNREYSIGTTYGRNGFGYLRKTVRGWNTAARGIPFVLLTDRGVHALSHSRGISCWHFHFFATTEE